MMLKELGVSRIQSQDLTSHRTGCLAEASDEMSTSTESDSLASLFVSQVGVTRRLARARQHGSQA
jgi:hypothetical protein